MNVITRFAPSPTGYIHVGNIRTALVCYLFAKQNGGKFMLRLDDTDKVRSKQEYADQIAADLKWLGLNWDFMAKQSERLERYEEIKELLYKNSRIYPCFESQEELDIKRKMALKLGRPPIYDRAALKLSKNEIDELIKSGKKPHWRFKLDESKPIVWDDMIKGKQHFEAKNLSDPILIREDGTPTYMLPSAIDDMDFKISHIVRGEDHVTNTAIQIQIFEAIGSHIPTFAHQSLIKGNEGKISKRVGGFDIRSLRDENIEPLAITSFLARLGTSEPILPRTSLEELWQNFDLTKFSKAAAIYDPEELKRLNAKVVHLLSHEQISLRLKDQGLEPIDSDFWDSIKNNIAYISEIQVWNSICRGDIICVKDPKDHDFLKAALSVLPEGNWDENTWSSWINAIKTVSDRKGKELFMPLRLAITGVEHGPELKFLLPLIGREKVIYRLTNN